MSQYELLKNFTLLYVEDDLETKEGMFILLKKYLKEIYCANDGEEGLSLYKDKMPDIVLSDIAMPKMNGLELSEKIKEINPNQNIILLTAFNETNFLKQAINIGIDKYIVKPVKREYLFNTLESIAKLLQSDIDKKNLENIIQVQSKVAAMGEMVSNIAHQWRQPLNVVSAIASGIRFDLEYDNVDKNKIVSSIDDILFQVNYLSQTIDDFRNFFKPDNSSMKQNFSIKNTILKVINLSKESFKSTFINIVPNIEDFEIYQNENQFVQVLINIFNNAKDAFTITNLPTDRYFFIDTKIKEDSIEIILKDNAGGIKEDVINKIFEPYFTTKHQSLGTGVGLYMSNQIIQKQFNGTIEVSNQEFEFDGKIHKGAQFKIILALN